MASFPTSVRTFTTKNDGAGNTISASHVNDLQDEVNAIEAGYLNGTAQLNSSNSTVVALSAGASTLTALQCANSTITALTVTNLTASSLVTRPLMPPPLAVRLTVASTGFNLAHNTTIAVSWLTQTFATNSSVHSTATESDRLNPQSTGVYQVNCVVGLSNNLSTGSSETLRVLVQDSSGAMVAMARGGYDGQPSAPFSQIGGSGLKRFDVVSTAAYLRVEALQNMGTTNSLSSLSYVELVKL